MVAAYEAVRPLTEEERRHLHDALKLVFLMSVSWFIDSPEHSAPDRRGVAYLDALGIACANCFASVLFPDAPGPSTPTKARGRPAARSITCMASRPTSTISTCEERIGKRINKLGLT